MEDRQKMAIGEDVTGRQIQRLESGGPKQKNGEGRGKRGWERNMFDFTTYLRVHDHQYKVGIMTVAIFAYYIAIWLSLCKLIVKPS